MAGGVAIGDISAVVHRNIGRDFGLHHFHGGRLGRRHQRSTRLCKDCTDQQRHQEKAEFYPHIAGYVANYWAQQYTFC